MCLLSRTVSLKSVPFTVICAVIVFSLFLICFFICFLILKSELKYTDWNMYDGQLLANFCRQFRAFYGIIIGLNEHKLTRRLNLTNTRTFH